MSRPLAIAVYVFTLLFFGVFFFGPIWLSLREAFLVNGEWTFGIIVETLRNPVFQEGLINAFKMGLGSTLGAILIALPLAVLADRYRFPGKTLFSALILLPLILPPFVGAIGVRQILGQAGALNAALIQCGMMDPAAPVDWLGQHRLLGVIVMNALHLFPIIYLNVTAALANIDPAMEEAAQNLGAPLWKRFAKITLPLTMPGLFAGATIVFIWSFTELGVPLLFGLQRVTSVQIFDGIKDLAGNPFPYALVVILLVTTVVIFAISKLLFGRTQLAPSGRASMGRTVRSPGAIGAWVCSILFLGVTLVAVLPHAGVVLLSVAGDWYQSVLPTEFTFDHYRDALGHPLTLASIKNSLIYASGSTIIDLFLGLGIAYIVVRTRLRGRQILDAMAMLPLAVPGLVLAFGLLAMSREKMFSFLAGDPALLLVIAYAVRRLPYVVRSAAAGYEQTSPTLEEAARNLGAPPLRALRKITLPLISANVIAGGLLAFAFAMLEVSDSLILAARQSDFPITKAIYALFDALGNGHRHPLWECGVCFF